MKLLLCKRDAVLTEEHSLVDYLLRDANRWYSHAALLDEAKGIIHSLGYKGVQESELTETKVEEAYDVMLPLSVDEGEVRVRLRKLLRGVYYSDKLLYANLFGKEYEGDEDWHTCATFIAEVLGIKDARKYTCDKLYEWATAGK